MADPLTPVLGDGIDMAAAIARIEAGGAGALLAAAPSSRAPRPSRPPARPIESTEPGPSPAPRRPGERRPSARQRPPRRLDERARRDEARMRRRSPGA